MTRELNTMKAIMDQKTKDISEKELMPLDPEGAAVAEHKRFTLDMVGTPVDPLR